MKPQSVTNAATAMAVIVGVVVPLIAAAVTRRLHDSGRSGAWGLLPLPFPGVGLYAFPRAVPDDSDDVDVGAFLLMFINNAVYLTLVGLLAWMLFMPSDASENRFGRPPPPR